MRAPLALAAVLLTTPALAEQFTCTGADVILRIDARGPGCVINGRVAQKIRATPLLCTLAEPTPRRLSVLEDLRFTLEEDRSGRVTRGTCVRQL